MNLRKKIFITAAMTLFVVFGIFKPVSAKLEESDIAATFAEDTESLIASLSVSKSKYKSNRRPILVGGAMNAEIGVLVRALKNPIVYKHLNYTFIAGTYKDYPVVISRTEMFLTNAATSTALGLINFNPVAVINQGTAGGYIETLHVGDIVISKSSVNTSAIKTEYLPKGAGIDPTQQELIGTCLYDKNAGKFTLQGELFSDPQLVNLAESIKGFRTITGVIGSTDGWNNNIDYINFLNKKYGVICEEMETNAVAQICLSAGVPCIGVRVISNNITNGEQFEPSAAEESQKFVLILLEKYISDVLKK